MFRGALHFTGEVILASAVFLLILAVVPDGDEKKIVETRQVSISTDLYIATLTKHMEEDRKSWHWILEVHLSDQGRAHILNELGFEKGFDSLWAWGEGRNIVITPPDRIWLQQSQETKWKLERRADAHWRYRWHGASGSANRHARVALMLIMHVEENLLPQKEEVVIHPQEP